MLLILIALFINAFALVCVVMAFIEVGNTGKIFLITAVVLSILVQILFRTWFANIVLGHIGRFVLGVGSYIYLKFRGDL